MKPGFSRRIFTAGTLLSDVGFLLGRIPSIVGALRDERISRAFVEKIMTVTSAVNGCTYCSWFHAKQALASGISEEEVKNMLNLQFQADATDFDTPALLYAQHISKTDLAKDDQMTRRLLDFYGERTAGHIVLFIRVIVFGNLLGNTWDAVLSRLKGEPAQGSSVVFECVFFLLTFWFMLPTMILSRRESTKRSLPGATPDSASVREER